MARKRQLKGKAVRLKGNRVYPQVGSVDTMADVRELIRTIESDNIPEGKKRQRLQFLYSLTFSQNFKGQFRSSIGEARRAFKLAYERHMR